MAGSNHSNNPFMDAFKMFTDNNVFNPSKAMPAFDINHMVTMQKRNAEMVSAANQAVAEGMQAMMRRQAELMHSGAADMFQLVKEMAISPSPEAGMAKQSAYMKSNVESAMSNTREMAEMAIKSGMEVFDMMSQAVSNNMFGAAQATHSKKKTA